MLIVLLTATTIGTVFFYKGNEFLVENEFNLITEKAGSVAPLMTSGISSTLEDAQFLADDPLVKTVNEVVDDNYDETFRFIEEDLKTFLKSKKDILRVSLFVGENNVRTYMSVARKGKESVTSTDEVFNLQHITQRRNFFLTPIKLYGSKNEPFVGVVVPIKNKKRVIGFLKLDLSLERDFIQLRNDLDLKYSLYIFNSEGDYLYHPNASKSFGFEKGIRYQIQSDFPRIESFLFGKDQTLSLTLKDHLFYTMKIPLLASEPTKFLGIGISISKEKVLGQNIILRKKSYLWTFLILSLTTLIAWYFSRFLTKNIAKVTELAQEFARGKTDLDIDIKSNDEIGVLAISFQGMIRQVNERTRILKKSERETRLAKDQLESISRGKSLLLKDLRKQKDEIEKIGRDKDELLAIVSHDLKNPLAVIETAMDLLQEESERLSKSDLELVGRSKHSAKFALNLITDLLDMARLEGGIKLDHEKFNIGELVEDSIENYKMKAEEKEITIDYHFDDDFILLGDYGRIIQVTNNILGNALKFTPKGGKISIRGEAICDLDSVGESLKVTISDTGPGIPKDKIETIFNKYEQARVKDREIGTGLGLAICKNIVELHGGKVWVESEESKGASFHFILPGVSRGIVNNISHVPRIMLIDDHIDFIKDLETSLVQKDYLLTHCNKGLDAEEQAENERVDLVLLDLDMKQSNPLEILKRLKETKSFKDVPFIILAEAIRTEDLVILNKLANDFVKKSSGMEKINQKIFEYLENDQDSIGNKVIDINLPTVLIVDDDENVREIVVESLEEYEVNVLYAKSGLEAVFMVKKYPVNVVLTDLRMPEIDGLKLSQMISSQSNKIDIVLMSGTIFDLPEEVRKKFSIHSLVSKPFNVVELSENLVSIAKKNFEGESATILPLVKKGSANEKRKILFVDDAEDMHMLFKVMMKKYPFEIDFCVNGEEGLCKFKEQDYDLVLMDVNMPVMDGKKAIKLMREYEINSNLEAVESWAITANNSPSDIEELLQCGFSDFMGKPLKKEKIIEFLIGEEKAVKSS